MNISFPCGSLSLEGYWDWPPGEGPFAAVAVCHPHPLFGGDMSNNVVDAVCQALAQKGVAAFRFNFRGVGRSGGSHGRGQGEQDDLKAALDFIAAPKGIDAERLGVAGYSFGAAVVLAALPHLTQAKALGLISPPLPSVDIPGVLLPTPDWDYVCSCATSKIIVGGAEDGFFPVQELRSFVERLAPPKQVEIIAGTDHFWWGRERQLAALIAGFFASNLGVL